MVKTLNYLWLERGIKRSGGGAPAQELSPFFKEKKKSSGRLRGVLAPPNQQGRLRGVKPLFPFLPLSKHTYQRTGQSCCLERGFTLKVHPEGIKGVRFIKEGGVQIGWR
jgi:hypothetical protein